MKSMRTVACGAVATFVLTGCPPQEPTDPTPTSSTTTTTTPPNGAPVAASDEVTWLLDDQAGAAPFATQSTTIDVLANDSDPDDDELTATGGGTWFLDGDLQPAGSFTVDPDGTLTIDSGTDPLGPVQQLRDGELWPATLQYSVSDGTLTATGTVTVTVVGGLDQVVQLGRMTGPDDQPVNFNDPVPTTFDARGCYGNPEGYHIQHFWQAASTSNLIPFDPAFFAGADVETVTALNQGWGFASSVTVTLTVLPDGGQASKSHAINFFVGDDPGVAPDMGAVCWEQSGRPYAPMTELPELDLRTVSGDTATFDGNVLTNAIEPQGRPMTAGGQGYIGDPADPHGTYRIHSDGTVSVTMDPDNPLADGQQYHANAPYRAVGPDGDIGVGELVLRVIGKG